MKYLLLVLLIISPYQVFAKNNNSSLVKKSKSGICHDTSSRWYKRTKNYTPYKSIKECLKSGGRLPKK